MAKFLKILKYVFTLGFGLYLDYKKEKSKTKVLILNIRDLLMESEAIGRMIKNGDKTKAILKALDEENLKKILVSCQTSMGLYEEIKADVKTLNQ